MLRVVKLSLTPLLISGVTLAGRRWGPLVSGLLIGLPLTTGPISLFLALEQGIGFATKAAIGGLVGQASICLFCLAYAHAARRLNWMASALCASGAFITATTLFNLIAWTLPSALAVLLLAIAIILRLLPKAVPSIATFAPPRWDLPARMCVATCFVLLVTGVAELLGPQLSGLVAPFPVFGLVFAVFSQIQQGGASSTNVLRGIVLGSSAYTCFFTIVGLTLPDLGIGITYALASLGAIAASGASYLLSRHKNRH